MTRRRPTPGPWRPSSASSPSSPCRRSRCAHPLGNFTINHYAGIRIEPSAIVLDIVVDQAEIPTFQARLDFDTDMDGEVSDAEADVGRVTACDELTPDLELTVADVRQAITLTRAGLTFPQGVGGLPTMRVVCEYRADLATPIAAATPVTFADVSFAERLGWREIVIQGSGRRPDARLRRDPRHDPVGAVDPVSDQPVDAGPERCRDRRLGGRRRRNAGAVRGARCDGAAGRRGARPFPDRSGCDRGAGSRGESLGGTGAARAWSRAGGAAPVVWPARNCRRSSGKRT